MSPSALRSPAALLLRARCSDAARVWVAGAVVQPVWGVVRSLPPSHRACDLPLPRQVWLMVRCRVRVGLVWLGGCVCARGRAAWGGSLSLMPWASLLHGHLVRIPCTARARPLQPPEQLATPAPHPTHPPCRRLQALCLGQLRGHLRHAVGGLPAVLGAGKVRCQLALLAAGLGAPVGTRCGLARRCSDPPTGVPRLHVRLSHGQRGRRRWSR